MVLTRVGAIATSPTMEGKTTVATANTDFSTATFNFSLSCCRREYAGKVTLIMLSEKKRKGISAQRCAQQMQPTSVKGNIFPTYAVRRSSLTSARKLLA